MISKPLKIILIVLVVGASGAAISFLHLSNARMRQRIAARQLLHQTMTRLRAEIAESKATLARTQGDEAAATAAIRADVTRVRVEIAEWEKRAAERNQQLTAKAATEAAVLETNRDPQKGITRLEHFQNIGQATPGSAFQTLVWAALKGDDATLTQVSTISPAARTKAEALIAGLVEEARAQWTPEKLAVMFFTGAFTEVTAAQVVGENAKDAQHVELSVRLKAGAKEPTIPFQWELGPQGWRVVFDEKFLAAVRKKIATAEGPPPKK